MALPHDDCTDSNPDVSGRAARTGARPGLTGSSRLPPSGDLEEALSAIVEVCPAQARPMLDALMDNLVTAQRAGGILRSKFNGLDVVLRKHLRQVWKDGIVAPLARTQNQIHRGVLVALPDLRDPRHAEQALDRVRALARDLPPGSPIGLHLGRAIRFLEALPTVMRAVSDLEAKAFSRIRHAPVEAAAPPSSLRVACTRRLRSIEQAFRRSASEALGPLPLVPSEAARGGDAVVVGGRAFPRASPIMRALSAGGQQRRRLDAAVRQGSVVEALQDDIWHGGLGANLESLMRRHPGLETQAVLVSRVGETGGQARVSLARAEVLFDLVARFDLGNDLLACRAEMLSAPSGSMEHPTMPDVNRCLDDNVPPRFDTRAHRLRRAILDRWEGGMGMAFEPSEANGLTVGRYDDRQAAAGFLVWLVDAADEHRVTLRFVATDPQATEAVLVRLGFVWADGRERLFMTRLPVPVSSSTYGP